MSRESSTKRKRSDIGKRGAAELKVVPRIFLTLLGLASLVGGWMLVMREGSPELGGTALLVIGALFLALAVIGRLPKILEVAGVPLEFETDEMAEFLRTLRASLDSDSVELLERQLKDMSADTAVFKDAQRQADASPGVDPGTEAATAVPQETSDPDPSWLIDLKSRSETSTVEREARVSGGRGSGRGQPPRVDLLVRDGERPILVVEEMVAWNDSTLEVLGRRLNRVIGMHSSVEKLVVITPAAGLPQVRKWQEEMWGEEGKQRVTVLEQGSSEALALLRWCDSLAPRVPPKVV